VKVVGTGAPWMLTIRVKSCEVKVLRDELEERRAVAVEAAANAQATQRRPAPGANTAVVEPHHDELFVISRLLDDLRRHVPRDQPRELVGPTWLLDPVIRGAAGEAVERLREIVDAFQADKGRVTPDELRAALDTACASTATLIGLDHAVNHAVEN
jgi:hypothetical protein